MWGPRAANAGPLAPKADTFGAIGSLLADETAASLAKTIPPVQTDERSKSMAVRTITLELSEGA
jgi:hypothetical protein